MIHTYKTLGLALSTALILTACGGGGSNDSNTSTDDIDTLIAETDTVGTCTITEGVPLTDTSITVKVTCEGSTNVEIDSVIVTVNGTSKDVEYESSNFTDYIGFGGLKADTRYEAVLSVQTSGQTLTGSVNIRTKSAPVVTTTSIIHNGFTYETVTSPYTGKVWLDRNLGAAQVCTLSTDTACYGDYYQWGRNFDGHQDSTSAMTATLATDVNAAGSSFITGSSDWASVDGAGTTRTANWSATDGSSVCPVGFRVPTLVELRAETLDNGVTDSATAFSNFLKLPSAGYRGYGLSALIDQGTRGNVWTSSVNGSFSHSVLFGSGAAGALDLNRADGFSVRCLRN